MSAIHVIEYLIGICFFGLTYWLLDGIQVEIQTASETGNLYDFMLYVWIGCIIIYLIFGGIWVVRRYNEPNMPGGLGR
jgi:hypothetical protein